jgi:hypothetical protein
MPPQMNMMAWTAPPAAAAFCCFRIDTYDITPGKNCAVGMGDVRVCAGVCVCARVCVCMCVCMTHAWG